MIRVSSTIIGGKHIYGEEKTIESAIIISTVTDTANAAFGDVVIFAGGESIFLSGRDALCAIQNALNTNTLPPKQTPVSEPTNK